MHDLGQDRQRVHAVNAHQVGALAGLGLEAAVPLGLGIALRRVVLAGFALGQVGVRIVSLAAAGHRRVEAAQLAALAGESDAGVNGHALDGVPGPGIAQIRVRGQIAAVQGKRLAQARGPPVLVPVETGGP